MEALPNTKLVQVIHVLNENSIDEALELAEFVDAVLLDSGNPNLSVKELPQKPAHRNRYRRRNLRSNLRPNVCFR